MLPDFIESHLRNRTLVSRLLWPLSLPYELAQRIHRWQRVFLPPKPVEPAPPIISIGNIVAGGTGKTPFTIMLTRELLAAGKHPAICLRGYRGKFEHDNRIVSTPQEILPDAREAGDEAFMLANALPGVPVAVGRKRRTSIRMLMERFPQTDVILLDDAFQHLDVLRDLDFVLFSLQTGLGNGYLLPAGVLREPLDALSHADCIVVTGVGDSRGDIENLERLKKRFSAIPASRHKPVLTVAYEIDDFMDTEGRSRTIESLKRTRCALMSGIATPGNFERTIRNAGIDFSRHFAFSDHYAYEDAQALQNVFRICREEAVEALVITEKDWSKLSQMKEFPLPVVVCRMKMRPLDPSLLWGLLGQITE